MYGSDHFSGIVASWCFGDYKIVYTESELRNAPALAYDTDHFRYCSSVTFSIQSTTLPSFLS
jgi:hypothetical protein